MAPPSNTASRPMQYLESAISQNVPGNPSMDISVNDIARVPPPGMNPYQQQIYDQVDRYNKAIPAQDHSTYFPSANQSINKGGYSGSIVGSLSLFAPNRLTPFGVFDAKQQALKDAAEAKAKEIDDFYTTFGKSPETTRKAVQDQLDEGYYSWLAGWTAIGQQRYGKDFARYLKNDTQFLKEQQSWNTVAKYNTQLVDETARIQADIKTGNFIASPELVQSMNYVMAGIDGLQQPGNQKAGDLSNNVLKMQTYYDLDKAVNQVLDELIQDVYETNPGISSQGIYDNITTTTTTSTDDSKLRELARELKATRYAGADNISEEMIYNNMRNKVGTKVERNVQQQGNQFAPSGGADFVYDETAINPEGERNVFGQTPDGSPNAVTTYDGQTLQKPINLNIVNSTDAIDPTTGRPINIAGNTQVQVGKTFNVLVDPNGGIITDDQRYTGSGSSPQIDKRGQYKTYAAATYTEYEDIIDPWLKQPTGQKRAITRTVWVPVDNIKGGLATFDPEGNVTKGARIDVQKKNAEQRNQNRNSENVKSSDSGQLPEITTEDQYNSLPVGAKYIYNGTEYTKEQ